MRVICTAWLSAFAIVVTAASASESEEPSRDASPVAHSVGLTEEVREHIGRSIREGKKNAGLTFARPLAIDDLLGLSYEPLAGRLVDEFLGDLAASGESDIGAGMVSILNLEVATPGREVSLPAEAALHVRLHAQLTTTPDKVDFRLVVPVYQKEPGRYFLLNPMDFLQNVQFKFASILERDDETQLAAKPTLTISHLEGFKFNDQTVEDFMPTGVPLVYKIGFGSVTVESGNQWAGRPTGLYGFDPVEEFVR